MCYYTTRKVTLTSKRWTKTPSVSICWEADAKETRVARRNFINKV